jgi:hypothetical protein
MLYTLFLNQFILRTKRIGETEIYRRDSDCEEGNEY